MDKKIAGLIGAAAAFASLDSAQAANTASPDPTEVLRAESYADLLNPIPNALALLQAVDAAAPDQALGDEMVAQYYYHHHHHHHHHHHRYYRRRVVPLLPWVAPYGYYRRYHHHHHHHHHHRYYRPYRDY